MVYNTGCLYEKNDIEKKYLYFDKDGKLVKDAITI